MNRRWFQLLLGAAGALSLLVASSAVAKPQASPVTGGTVIYGLDQEPKVLNPYITEGNLFATAEATEPVLDGGLEYNNRGTLQPVLFTGQPKMLKASPLTVRFSYKKAAKWSDGQADHRRGLPVPLADPDEPVVRHHLA